MIVTGRPLRKPSRPGWRTAQPAVGALRPVGLGFGVVATALVFIAYVFIAYSVGVAVTLLVAGSLSDRIIAAGLPMIAETSTGRVNQAASIGRPRPRHRPRGPGPRTNCRTSTP